MKSTRTCGGIKKKKFLVTVVWKSKVSMMLQFGAALEACSCKLILGTSQHLQ